MNRPRTVPAYPIIMILLSLLEVSCGAPDPGSSDAEIGTTRQAMNTSEPLEDTWFFPAGNIEVCFQPRTQADYDWDEDGITYEDWKDRIQTVVEGAYETIWNVHIDFHGWQDCDDWQEFQLGTKMGEVRVLVDIVNPHNLRAANRYFNDEEKNVPANPLPSDLDSFSVPRPTDGYAETVPIMKRKSSDSDSEFDTVILHEFGHALGFGLDETDCSATTGGTMFSTYDPMGIMTGSYCHQTPRLSPTDEVALHITYPDPYLGMFVSLKSAAIGFYLANAVLIREDGAFTPSWTAAGAKNKVYWDDGNSIEWRYKSGSTWHSWETSGREYTPPSTASHVQAAFDDFAGRPRSIAQTPVIVSNSMHTATVMLTL